MRSEFAKASRLWPSLITALDLPFPGWRRACFETPNAFDKGIRFRPILFAVTDESAASVLATRPLAGGAHFGREDGVPATGE
jgi:hypothetical protein